MANGKRLLFFDLLKILGIALVIIWHIWGSILKIYDLTIPIIGGIGMGRIGVILFLITCGALSELSYKKGDAILWVFRRLTRIYPAYWCSLIIALVILHATISSPLQALFEITSMSHVAGWANINGPAWFIGVIVIFYLVYPLLRKIIDYNPFCLGAFAVFLTFLIRDALIYQPSIIPWINEAYYYSPLGAFCFFVLGSYIARMGAYPSMESWPVISWLADFSFYVFLIHYTFLSTSDNLLVYSVVVVTFSLMVMALDEKIQVWLKKAVGG
jgi:peptidoglycan/LPS O-acetylase OafA/YrhL